jgi:hypothetical protein
MESCTDWCVIFKEATLVLGNLPQKLPVIIVGGSALMLHDLTRRPATHDIDVLSYHEALRDILANYRAVNSSVKAYVDQIPYNFEDRLVRVDIETATVEYLTPSLEDLAVMKLYGWRPNDQEDLESPGLLGELDWEKLDQLVYDPDEAQASALSQRRYREMVAVYEEYARKHGHEPNA